MLGFTQTWSEYVEVELRMETIAPDYERTDLGTIEIAPEVIEVIAGLATVEVDGVAGMSGGISSGIAELLGRKNLSKGVKVEVGQREAAVDVSIIVQYGRRIPEISTEIQRNVKRSIETMTGLNVVEVNVHIHDVHFKAGDKPEEDETHVRVR
jgi:uncharacterized alkaline shock family protein YloU